MLAERDGKNVGVISDLYGSKRNLKELQFWATTSGISGLS